jgi:hypothetical protein
MNPKDKDVAGNIMNFFQNINKYLPPLDVKHQPKNPFEIVQNVIDSINKLVDGVSLELEKLPPFMATIYDINRDAHKAFKQGRYSDYIELKYRGAEIFYKSLYREIFNKEIKEEDNLNDIIKEIEQKLNMNSGILRKLNKWRKVRNQIVHEHLKVNKRKADGAMHFFNKLYQLFKVYIKEVK